MTACKDCRHVFFPGPDDEGKAPRCHHPRSFKELPAYLTGEMHTVTHTINSMRTIGDCGDAAALFEPKER